MGLPIPSRGSGWEGCQGFIHCLPGTPYSLCACFAEAHTGKNLALGQSSAVGSFAGRRELGPLRLRVSVSACFILREATGFQTRRHAKRVRPSRQAKALGQPRSSRTAIPCQPPPHPLKLEWTPHPQSRFLYTDGNEKGLIIHLIPPPPHTHTHNVTYCHVEFTCLLTIEVE